MPFPRDDRQDRLLKPQPIWAHLLELFPDGRHLARDPNGSLLVDHKRLWHTARKRLLGCRGRGEVEQELKEDKVLDKDLAPKVRVGNLRGMLVGDLRASSTVGSDVERTYLVLEQFLPS
jgi:hypothetical protein